MFAFKNKSDYQLCVIEVCSCGQCFIGETKRNAEAGSNEHNNPTKNPNHQSTLDATSTTALHKLSFQMFQKVLRPGKT